MSIQRRLQGLISAGGGFVLAFAGWQTVKRRLLDVD
jgi:hypothetical protein